MKKSNERESRTGFGFGCLFWGGGILGVGKKEELGLGEGYRDLFGSRCFHDLLDSAGFCFFSWGGDEKYKRGGRIQV